MADDIEEMTDLTPEVSVPDDAGATSVAENPATEAPSTSKDVSNIVSDDTDEALLSVARDATGRFARKTEAEASSATEETAPQADEPETPKEQDNENFSDVPFNKHPRFQALLRERNEFKEGAQRAQNIDRFLDDVQLPPVEAADGLRIMGLAKTNPPAAWEAMRPFVQNLLVEAGEVLPPELEAEVHAGRMSPQGALELSRARAKAKWAGNQVSFTQQRFERQQQDAHASQVEQTVGAWEQDRRAKDPNFAAKIPALQEKVAWLQRQQGVPSDVTGVRRQLEEAYASIVLPAAIPASAAPPPRRQPVTPIRSGNVAGSAQPKPRNSMDAIEMVLAKSRA